MNKENNDNYIRIVRNGNMDDMYDFGFTLGLSLAVEILPEQIELGELELKGEFPIPSNIYFKAKEMLSEPLVIEGWKLCLEEMKRRLDEKIKERVGEIPTPQLK